MYFQQQGLGVFMIEISNIKSQIEIDYYISDIYWPKSVPVWVDKSKLSKWQEGNERKILIKPNI